MADDFLEWTKEVSSAELSKLLIDLDESDEDDRELIPGIGVASPRPCCDRCPNGSCRSCPCTAAGRDICPRTGQPYLGVRPVQRRSAPPVARMPRKRSTWQAGPAMGANPSAATWNLDMPSTLMPKASPLAAPGDKRYQELSKGSGGACEACDPTRSTPADAAGLATSPGAWCPSHGDMMMQFQYYAKQDEALDNVYLGMSTKDFLVCYFFLVLGVAGVLLILAGLGKL